MKGTQETNIDGSDNAHLFHLLWLGVVSAGEETLGVGGSNDFPFKL